MSSTDTLISAHGGYSKLATYRLGTLPENLAQLRQLMAELVHTLKSDRSDESDKAAHARLLLEVGCNTMITLINQETYLLKRQIARLAQDFEREGGFTERLYRVRREYRNEHESINKSDRSDKSDKKLQPTTIK